MADPSRAADLTATMRMSSTGMPAAFGSMYFAIEKSSQSPLFFRNWKAVAQYSVLPQLLMSSM